MTARRHGFPGGPAGLLALVAFVLAAPSVMACNVPLDPKMEAFMFEGDLVNNIGVTFPVPAGFINEGGGQKPIYVIDEGQTIKFSALWNCGAQSTVQFSDSNSVNLAAYMYNIGSWWNASTQGYLLPLAHTAVSSLLITASRGFPFGGASFPGEPQWLYSCGNSGSVVKDSAFCLVQTGTPSGNANYNTSNMFIHAASYPFTSTDGPSFEPNSLSAFPTGNFDDDLDDFSGSRYDLKSNANDQCLAANLPTDGDEYGPPAAKVKIYGCEYASGANWKFVKWGTRWNLDANGVGYLKDAADEHDTGDAEDVTREFLFPTPSDPVMYKVTVEVVFLFVLRGAVFSWKEALKTDYDQAITDGWDPTDTYSSGYEPTHTEHSVRVHGVRCSKVTDPAKQGICYIRVRDTTPPRSFAVNDADTSNFDGTTGDMLAEADVDDIRITVVDNNPYAPYFIEQGSVPALPGAGSPHDYVSSNLRLRIMYNTELYDYWAASSPRPGESGATADALGNAHMFNFWSPKMVWCQAALAAGSSLNPADAASVLEFDSSYITDAKTHAFNGSVLTWGSNIQINGTDGRLVVPASGGDAAYSTITWTIPAAAFREPLPLHLATNSERWQPGILRWFPVVSDVSGNWNPHAASDSKSPPVFTDRPDPTQTTDGTSNIAGACDANSSATDLPTNGDLTIADADFASDGRVSLEQWSAADAIVANLPAGFPVAAGSFGKYQTIRVVDDERPTAFLYVTDTKYGTTWRFGVGVDGDLARPALLQAGKPAWVKGTDSSSPFSTIRGIDLSRTAPGFLLSDKSVFPNELEDYGSVGTFADYDSFFGSGAYQSFAPSLVPPAGAAATGNLPGLWTDEDTRLAFKVVAFDNIDPFEVTAAGPPASFDYESVFEPMKAGDSFPRNGIDVMEWEIKDEPTAGTLTGSAATAYEDEYIFRNPNRPSGAQECSVLVRVDDTRDSLGLKSASLTRRLKVRFFVQDNKMKFRSIEERRRGVFRAN